MRIFINIDWVKYLHNYLVQWNKIHGTTKSMDWEMKDWGPRHCRSFEATLKCKIFPPHHLSCMVVTTRSVDGQVVFKGLGSSKGRAKSDAARFYLKSLNKD